MCAQRLSGDTLVDVELPELEEGDIVLILETGGLAVGEPTAAQKRNRESCRQLIGARRQLIGECGTSTHREG